MIMVWMGGLPLRRALGSGAIAVTGPPTGPGLPGWLRLNLLADVPRPAVPTT